jgi:hypothetical protein
MRIKPKFSCLLLLCFCLSTIQAVSSTQGVVTLPQTGQTKCYNAFGVQIACVGTGQDGEYQMGAGWPDPRFTSSGDCMTDHLTGLMWSKNSDLPNGTMNWQGALDYVKA